MKLENIVSTSSISKACISLNLKFNAQNKPH